MWLFIPIIGGVGPRVKTTGKVPQQLCPHCGAVGSCVLRKTRLWLKLFFVPILPLSRGRPFIQCLNCRCVFDPRVIHHLPPNLPAIETIHMCDRCPTCKLAFPAATGAGYCPSCGTNLEEAIPTLIPAK